MQVDTSLIAEADFIKTQTTAELFFRETCEIFSEQLNYRTALQGSFCNEKKLVLFERAEAATGCVL